MSHSQNVSTHDEELEEGEEPMKMSFLDPNTIAWMNKRRPGAASGRSKALITPSRALQLRTIFRGLDFDGSGEISLEEMQEALRYVGETDPSMDVDKIMRFFVDMDTDGNGSIDYDEFLAGMSADTGTVSAEQSAKMQEAFFNFANNHQRQQLIDQINNTQMEDCDRYQGFMKLFEFQSLVEQAPGSKEEELERAKKQAEQDKKEMGVEHWLRRRAEFTRSRRAQLAMEIDKQHHNKNSRFNRMIRNSDMGNVDYDSFSRAAHKKLRNRMSNYRLNSACTYAPPLSSIRSMPLLRLESMVISQNMMQSQVKRGGLPPVSVRAQASKKTRAKVRRETMSLSRRNKSSL